MALLLPSPKGPNDSFCNELGMHEAMRGSHTMVCSGNIVVDSKVLSSAWTRASMTAKSMA
jgi:hypothetical protein